MNQFMVRAYLGLAFAVGVGGYVGSGLDPVWGGAVGALSGLACAVWYLVAERHEWGTTTGFKPLGIVAATAGLFSGVGALIFSQNHGLWGIVLPPVIVSAIALPIWCIFRKIEADRAQRYAAQQAQFRSGNIP